MAQYNLADKFIGINGLATSAEYAEQLEAAVLGNNAIQKRYSSNAAFIDAVFKPFQKGALQCPSIDNIIAASRVVAKKVDRIKNDCGYLYHQPAHTTHVILGMALLIDLHNRFADACIMTENFGQIEKMEEISTKEAALLLLAATGHDVDRGWGVNRWQYDNELKALQTTSAVMADQNLGIQSQAFVQTLILVTCLLPHMDAAGKINGVDFADPQFERLKVDLQNSESDLCRNAEKQKVQLQKTEILALLTQPKIRSYCIYMRLADVMTSLLSPAVAVDGAYRLYREHAYNGEAGQAKDGQGRPIFAIGERIVSPDPKNISLLQELKQRTRFVTFFGKLPTEIGKFFQSQLRLTQEALTQPDGSPNSTQIILYLERYSQNNFNALNNLSLHSKTTRPTQRTHFAYV